MKKLIALALLVFSLVPVMADKVKVCIWPEKKEVINCFNDYLQDFVELIPAVIKPDSTLMKTGDRRLMEMMCESTGCDVIVVPYTESIEDFTHNIIYVYKAEDGSFTGIFENIQDNVSILEEKEVVKAISDVILDQEEAQKINTYIISGPVVELPEIKIEKNLKPDWLKDKSLFSNAKQDFYKSFAITLGAFGAKVLINSYNIDNNNKNLRIADTVSTGLIVISATMMLRNLFDYCRYADFVSP